VALGQKKAASTSGVGSMLSNLSNPFRKKKTNGAAAPMPIKGLIPGMALHFAGCCHPIPATVLLESSPPARA